MMIFTVDNMYTSYPVGQPGASNGHCNDMCVPSQLLIPGTYFKFAGLWSIQNVCVILEF